MMFSDLFVSFRWNDLQNCRKIKSKMYWKVSDLRQADFDSKFLIFLNPLWPFFLMLQKYHIFWLYIFYKNIDPYLYKTECNPLPFYFAEQTISTPSNQWSIYLLEALSRQICQTKFVAVSPLWWFPCSVIELWFWSVWLSNKIQIMGLHKITASMWQYRFSAIFM